jgi:uncharacterized membrane protein YhaH (DUF805 family)
MTTRSIKEPVPDKFPPAKLYLDDLEEIVTVLREAIETKKPTGTNPEDLQIDFAFKCTGRQCDTREEVPNVLKANREFSLEISRGWTDCKLTCHPWFYNMWRTSGLTEENAWTAYRRLKPIFERRKRRLSAFTRSIPFWGWIITGLLAPLLLHFVAHTFEPKISYRSAEWLEKLLVVTYIIVFIGSGFRHTTLSPQKSHERSFSRTLLVEKIIPTIGLTLLGVLGTLLTQFLMHKFWPKP